mmetsp:Transcript_13562/g.57412  ORF Transcript_13562/g.57412 Transcript_13562/m.57412 type:complete len:391 (-) Transcript_13562:6-1178(-)
MNSIPPRGSPDRAEPRARGASSEELLDLVHHEEHARVSRRRAQQARHQTRVEPPQAALFVQLGPGVEEAAVLSLSLVDGIRHHRALDDVDGVEQGPIQEPAEAAREHDLPVPRLAVLVRLREVVLGVLEHAEVDGTRGEVADQRRAERLVGPPNPVVLERCLDALADGLVWRDVVRVLLRLDDLRLPLRLEQVDGRLEKRTSHPREQTRLRVGHRIVRGDADDLLRPRVTKEQGGAEEHLPRERRRDALVQALETLGLYHFRRRVQRAFVRRVRRGLRLQEHLDGVERVADEGDGDATARAGEDVLGGADERGLGLRAGRGDEGGVGGVREARGDGVAPARVRDAHARRVQHGAEALEEDVAGNGHRDALFLTTHSRRAPRHSIGVGCAS